MAIPAIPIINGIIGIFKTGGEILKNWQERKKVISEGKIAIAQAKVEGQIKVEQTRVEGDLQYDNIAAEGMRFSWKDEWMLILLSLPFIGCFIPPLTVYIKQGFIVLATDTPDWYQWAFLGAVVASFGLKDWFKKLLKV